MKELHNIEEINKLIQESKMAFIYFSGTTCGACEVIRLKIEKLLANYPDIQSGFMNADLHPELAGSFRILSVPQFILYVFGKETIHEGKYFDLLDLERKINRYYRMIQMVMLKVLK